MDDNQHIYLVRHGEAKPKDEDPQRGLTAAGEEAVRKIASWAATNDVRVVAIRHSGKLRAEQTATIISAALKSDIEPRAVSGLNPNDDVVSVAGALVGEAGSVMLVGHLPFLGRLVSQLVVGDPDQDIVVFAAAAMVRLSRQENQWIVDCVMAPDMLD